MPTTDHCIYYALENVSLSVSERRHPVQLSVPYCRLSEAMGERMRTTALGSEVLKLITITPLHAGSRIIVGPDMNPIDTPICLRGRQRQQCEPAFVQLLDDLGLESTLPAAETEWTK